MVPSALPHKNRRGDVYYLAVDQGAGNVEGSVNFTGTERIRES